MIYDKENNISDLTEVPTIVYSVEYSMAFNNNNSEVGKLSWGEGELKFTGNADDAAKLLFEHLLKPYVDQYIAKELEQVKQCHEDTLHDCLTYKMEGILKCYKEKRFNDLVHAIKAAGKEDKKVVKD
jgi:hypothetical protein